MIHPKCIILVFYSVYKIVQPPLLISFRTFSLPSKENLYPFCFFSNSSGVPGSHYSIFRKSWANEGWGLVIKCPTASSMVGACLSSPPFFLERGASYNHITYKAPGSWVWLGVCSGGAQIKGAQHFSISMPHPAVCRRQQLGSESSARTWPWIESQVFELEVSQLSLLCLGFRSLKEDGWACWVLVMG